MSQSNEHEDHLKQTTDEFAQRLKSFRPRAARISIDEILAEGSSERNSQPAMLSAHSVASPVSGERISNSWLRVGVAWTCGMAMGAAITAILMTQFQSSSGILNDRLVSDSSRGADEILGSSNPAADESQVTKTSTRHPDWATRFPMELSDHDFQGNSPLAVSYRFRMHEMQPRSDRTIYSPGHTESDQSANNPEHSTYEINFEPGEPKSQRHTLMRELLGETI